jgi:hypothetical protein
MEPVPGKDDEAGFMSHFRRATPAAPPDEIRERIERYARVHEIAGHRVVRRLSTGTRGALILARDGVADESDSGLVALKIFHPATDALSIEVELAALCLPAHPHIVRLIDVASIVPGEPPALVLQRLQGPTLAARLQEVPGLTTAEAVTALAPLCAAVQYLHDNGVTHGEILTRRVLFDARGAPVLTGFGRGTRRPPAVSTTALSSTVDEIRQRAALAAWRQAVLDEQRQVMSLVTGVLETVVDASDARIAAVSSLTAMIGTGPSAALLPALESELFRSSRPRPVSLAAAVVSESLREPETSTGALQEGAESIARHVPQGNVPFDWTTPRVEHPAEPSEYRLVSALRVLGASPGVLHGLDRTIEHVEALGRRRGSMSQHPAEPRPRRIAARPLIVASCGAAVLLCASLLVLPGEDSGQARERNRPDVTSTSTAPAATRGSLSASTPEQQAAIVGDDPVAAFGALAARRQMCLDAAVASCLAEVDQAGSPAMRADESFLRGLGQAPPTAAAANPVDVIDSHRAELVERVGGSAIVSGVLNEQPASFLLMKGEAGWRLREFFERSG